MSESCRVARQKLLVTVAHRAWMFPLLAASSLTQLGMFPQAVYAMLEQGEWHFDQFPDNAKLSKSYLGAFKAFLPKEVQRSLEQNGLHVLRCGGLGYLANLCSQETLELALNDDALLNEFLDLCERYDMEMLPDGPGTRQRVGLIAVAERIAK